jgi:8-oxo-dGTP pyrophosphatase MutT (NUDIX family)
MDEAAPLQPAATVVLLRDAAGALETLLIQRGQKLVFFGGAWAFVGGRVDDEDRAGAGDELAAARIAAVRETREESGLVLDAADLVPFSHWTTPPGPPRRFATWFFLARATGEGVQVDGEETLAHRWITPRAAIEARARGEIEIPPPTYATLAKVARFPDVQSALARARCEAIIRYAPRILPVEAGTVSLYEGDVAYEGGDLDRPGPRRRMYRVASGWRYEDDV